MAQARCESEFALSDVERRVSFAQRLIVETRLFFERGVAHRGMVTIDVEGAHARLFPRPRRASLRLLSRRRPDATQLHALRRRLL